MLRDPDHPDWSSARRVSGLLAELGCRETVPATPLARRLVAADAWALAHGVTRAPWGFPDERRLRHIGICRPSMRERIHALP